MHREQINTEHFTYVIHYMLAEQQKMILYAIFAFHTQQKQEILHQIWLFLKKIMKMFGGIKKTSYLCTRKKQKASFLDADKHCKT